jgi:hypothetical protein
MNSKIIEVTSRRQIAIERNLEEFINQAKTSGVFGKEFNFELNVWDVTDFLNQKSKRTGTTLVFSAWGQPRPSAKIQPRWLQEPFLSFSKAFVIHEFELTRKISFMRDLQALRAISHALDLAESVSPTCITLQTLEAAQLAVKKKYNSSTAHGIGSCIKKIASLLDEKGIGRIQFRWRSSLPAPVPHGRIGKEFENRRQEKMPSAEILAALGHAYCSAVDPEDIVYTSMCALMLSSPDRANEVVSLLVDCESPTQGDGSPGYSLRWWPSKGALPQIKAIPKVMRELVQNAITRIKKVTDQPRVIAKWYEDQLSSHKSYPTKIYLPDHLEYLRSKELLTRDEISLLLWNDDTQDLDVWCKSKNLVAVSTIGRKSLHRFSDVEKIVISDLPKHFPYSDNTRRWKCSELLFTLPKFSVRLRRPSMCLYTPMDRVDLNYRLDGKNKRSIFAKFGINEIVDGEIAPLKISSHAFRHYLNHLAHETGELSETDINLWSGRTSRGEAYNHLSSKEISDRATSLLGESLSSLPAVRAYPVQLYARKEFKRLGIEVGHTTDFGYCVHDFSASPCEKHEDCLNCSEQFCIKGDSVKQENLKREVEELKQLLSKADAAAREGVYGADRWLDAQKLRLHRANELLSVMENPRVLVGTPIRLTGQRDYSELEHLRSIALQDGMITSSVIQTSYLEDNSTAIFSLLAPSKTDI